MIRQERCSVVQSARYRPATEPLTRRATGGDLCRWKDDVTVIVEAKARIMSHLPGMAVEVKEHAGVAAVESLRRLASDFRPVRARLLDDLVNLLVRPNIVSEGHTTPTCTVIGDASVLREFVACP